MIPEYMYIAHPITFILLLQQYYRTNTPSGTLCSLKHLLDCSSLYQGDSKQEVPPLDSDLFLYSLL
jgi:hypothetical protein